MSFINDSENIFWQLATDLKVEETAGPSGPAFLSWHSKSQSNGD
jgi:hypothetical protein